MQTNQFKYKLNQLKLNVMDNVLLKPIVTVNTNMIES